MKSKKHMLLVIMVSAMLLVAVSGTAIALGAGRTEILTLPDADTVLSMSMNQYNDYSPVGEVVITDKNEITQILTNLSGASKLWGISGMSVNDSPLVANYLVINIAVENGARRLSLYTDDRNYIESPYDGVFKTKQPFDYIYSLYWAYRNNLMPNTIAENAIQPVVTLYSFDQSKDNGDSDQVKRHFTSRLHPDVTTDMTVLTDMIFIDVQVPVGSLSMRTYYAEATGPVYQMGDSKWSHPHQYSLEESLHPSGNTFSPRDINPDGFTGSIWAVTTDADGVEHTSDVIPVVWFNPVS